MNMKKIIITVFAALLLCSCSDLLDRPTLTRVVDNNFWRGDEDVRLYVNGFYPTYFEGYGVEWDQEFAPVRGGTKFCDDFTSEGTQGRFTNKVPTSLGSSSESRSCNEQYYGSTWGFGRTRKINILIDRLNEYRENFTDEEYNHWLAVAYFFKVYEYSDLVSVYGAVPYFESTVRSDDLDTQYKDRDNRQFVMDKVYDMCEFILENMREDDGEQYLNRYIAAGFISRFMLNEGTWQKYHAGEDYCDEEHAKKYLELAVKAGSYVIDSGKWSFGSSYKDLFASESLKGNSEVLLYRAYDAGLNIFHCIGSYTGGSESQTGCHLELIKAYNCQDGKPYTMSSDPLANSFYLKDLVASRDPRFFDTFYKESNKSSSTMMYCYKFASYEAIEEYHKTGNQLPEWKGIANTNDAPVMRLGEIVLNWIEAKAELATLGGPAVVQDDIDKSINALRNRPLSAAAAAAVFGEDKENNIPGRKISKTSPLDINNIPNDPNRDSDVSALLWEIRRERRMELLHEGNRIKDLLRWYKLDYMNYDNNPDKYLGPWIDFNEGKHNQDFMRDRINVLTVQDADGNLVKYNGSNAEDMVGFYCVRNASNRETFFDRSYMAPIGQNQIDEYKMRGYTLTQTVNW